MAMNTKYRYDRALWKKAAKEPLAEHLSKMGAEYHLLWWHERPLKVMLWAHESESGIEHLRYSLAPALYGRQQGEDVLVTGVFAALDIEIIRWSNKHETTNTKLYALVELGPLPGQRSEEVDGETESRLFKLAFLSKFLTGTHDWKFPLFQIKEGGSEHREKNMCSDAVKAVAALALLKYPSVKKALREVPAGIELMYPAERNIALPSIENLRWLSYLTTKKQS